MHEHISGRQGHETKQLPNSVKNSAVEGQDGDPARRRWASMLQSGCGKGEKENGRSGNQKAGQGAQPSQLVGSKCFGSDGI